MSWLWWQSVLTSILEPQSFNPLRRGWVYRLAREALPFRGMPTGPEVFLELPGASGPMPCAWTHLKKALVRLLGRMTNTKYQLVGHLGPSGGVIVSKLELETFHESVRFSLDAPFIQPGATLKQKEKKLFVNYNLLLNCVLILVIYQT